MFKVYTSIGLPRTDDSDETILMGYKGPVEIDTGYVFTPYIPVIMGGVVINPQTFEPTTSLLVRCGKTTLKSEDHTPAAGAAYYGKMTITGLV